jgi:cell division protein FtsW (lipid II flippase)
MNSFQSSGFVGDRFFTRQLIWIVVSAIIFFIASNVDWSFLRNTKVIVIMFVTSVGLLSALFFIGAVYKGAQSWFNLGAFSFLDIF